MRAPISRTARRPCRQSLVQRPWLRLRLTPPVARLRGSASCSCPIVIAVAVQRERAENPNMRLHFHSVVKSISTKSALCGVLAITHIAAISVTAQMSPARSDVADNPLLTESPLPYHVPAFDKIKDEH